MSLALSSDTLYRILLGFFVLFSISSIFIFWRASSRLKIIMILLTFVEIAIVVFISFLLFRESAMELQKPIPIPKEPSQVLAKKPPLPQDQPVSGLIENASISGNTRKLFLTAETLKSEQQYVEALQYYEACYNQIKETQNPLKPSILFRIADMNRVLNQTEKALSTFYKALEAFKKKNDLMGTARVLNRVGRTEYQLSNFSLAIRAHSKALKLFEKLSHKSKIASAHHGIGNALLSQGSLQEAEKHFQKARALFLSIGNKKGLAHALLKEADIHIICGRYGKATDDISKALSIFKEKNDIEGKARADLAWSKLCFELSKNSSARIHVEKAIILFKKTRSKRLLGIAYQALARSALRQGNTELCLHNIDKAIHFFEKSKDKRYMGTSYAIKGEALSISGTPEKGIQYVDRSIALLQEIGDRVSLARALCSKGSGHYLHEELDHAESAFLKASALYKSLNLLKGEALGALGLGNLYCQKSQYRKSHLQFYKAIKIFKSLKDPYWELQAIVGLSRLETLMDNPQRAQSFIDESLEKARYAEDLISESRILRTSASVSYSLGNYEKTRMLLESALASFKRIKYRRGIIQILCKQAQLHAALGDYKISEQLLNELQENLNKQKSFPEEIKASIQRGFLLHRTGKILDAINLYKETFKRLKARPHQTLCVLLFRRMADAYITMGRYNAALSCLDEGSEYLKKLPGITRGAKYNILRGLIALKIGDLEKAEALFEKSLKTFKICGNKRWIGISHHRIGETNYYIGDFEKADYHLGKALRLFGHIGAKARSTKVLAGYGVLFSRQGRLHHAASFFGKALMLARQTGDVINETYILSALAEIKRHTDPPSVQEHTFKQALEKTRIIHDTVGEAYALCGLSYTKAKIGLYKEATRLAKQSLDLFKKANHIIGSIRATKYLGDIAYAQKKYRSARKSFNSLLEQTRKDNISQIKGDLYKRLGHIEFKTGNLEKALRYYEEALSATRLTSSRRNRMRILRHVARVRAILLNEYTYPKEAFTKALRHFKETNDRLFEADTLLKVGDLEYQFGNDKEALAAYKESLELSIHLKQPLLQRRAHTRIGSIFSKTDNPAEALNHLQAALKLTESMQDASAPYASLKGLALFYKSQGKIKIALAHAIKAQKCLGHVESSYEKKVMKDLIATLSAPHGNT